MTSGLRIHSASERHLARWIIVATIMTIASVSLYFGLVWYTKGDLPPIIPVPASAKADTSVDESSVSQAQINAYTVSASQPRYISIPSLSIHNARVQQVGLTKNNTLDTPKNIADAAWFTKSSLPGNGSGAVVIDGHNGGISRDGVFANLGKLKQGDEIIIERGDGKKINYALQENKTLSLQQANTTGMRDMMRSIDPAKEGLSLITCAGNWVPRDKIFDKRIMVRAIAK